MANELEQLLDEAYNKGLSLEATQYLLAVESQYSLSLPEVRQEFKNRDCRNG